MTTTLDHLTIIAPSLEEGVAHVRACLDIDIPFGGRHAEMGTYNHLLRLGDDIFLEIIAVDPAASAPKQRRWFGLDDGAAVRAAWDAGFRLRGWVARTDDLDVVLARQGDLLGQATRVSRGERTWRFAIRPDGALPAGGAAPCVIDWGPRGTPAPAMPDLGARLRGFALAHPDLAAIAALYETLAVGGAPELHTGATMRYRASIDTPHGIKELW